MLYTDYAQLRKTPCLKPWNLIEGRDLTGGASMYEMRVIRQGAAKIPEHCLIRRIAMPTDRGG